MFQTPYPPCQQCIAMVSICHTPPLPAGVICELPLTAKCLWEGGNIFLGGKFLAIINVPVKTIVLVETMSMS